MGSEQSKEANLKLDKKRRHTIQSNAQQQEDPYQSDEEEIEGEGEGLSIEEVTKISKPFNVETVVSLRATDFFENPYDTVDTSTIIDLYDIKNSKYEISLDVIFEHLDMICKDPKIKSQFKPNQQQLQTISSQVSQRQSRTASKGSRVYEDHPDFLQDVEYQKMLQLRDSQEELSRSKRMRKAPNPMINFYEQKIQNKQKEPKLKSRKKKKKPKGKVANQDFLNQLNNQLRGSQNIRDTPRRFKNHQQTQKVDANQKLKSQKKLNRIDSLMKNQLKQANTMRNTQKLKMTQKKEKSKNQINFEPRKMKKKHDIRPATTKASTRNQNQFFKAKKKDNSKFAPRKKKIHTQQNQMKNKEVLLKRQKELKQHPTLAQNKPSKSKQIMSQSQRNNKGMSFKQGQENITKKHRLPQGDDFRRQKDNIFNTFIKKDPTKSFTALFSSLISVEYQFKQLLGSGASGNVYGILRRDDQEILACKVVKLVDWDLNDLKNEITLMSTCQHKNIVKYYETFYYSNCLFIIMELMDQGSLLHYIKEVPKMSEKCIAAVVYQILCALKFLHASFQIHRDIKSDNIMLNTKGEIKLVDFGFAAQLTQSKKFDTSTLGTPLWMAPEVI